MVKIHTSIASIFLSLLASTAFAAEKPKQGWFVLFRFFGLERGYYDRSWKLPDFEKVK